MLSIMEAGIPANSGPINIYFNGAPQQQVQSTQSTPTSSSPPSGPMKSFNNQSTHPISKRGPNPNGLWPAMKSMWYSNYNPKNWNWNYILRGAALGGAGYGLYWTGKKYYDAHPELHND